MERVYQVLLRHRQFLKRCPSFWLRREAIDRLLTVNASLSGADFTLKRIAGRLKRKNELGEAVIELQHHYRELEDDFRCFFPALAGFVTSVLETRRPGLQNRCSNDNTPTESGENGALPAIDVAIRAAL